METLHDRKILEDVDRLVALSKVKAGIVCRSLSQFGCVYDQRSWKRIVVSDAFERN